MCTQTICCWIKYFLIFWQECKNVSHSICNTSMVATSLICHCPCPLQLLYTLVSILHFSPALVCVYYGLLEPWQQSMSDWARLTQYVAWLPTNRLWFWIIANNFRRVWRKMAPGVVVACFDKRVVAWNAVNGLVKNAFKAKRTNDRLAGRQADRQTNRQSWDRLKLHKEQLWTCK